MNAELQYLKDIADALRKGVSSGSSSSSKGLAGLTGNFDISALTSVIEAALLVTEDDETVSVLEQLRDALKEQLEAALFVTSGSTTTSLLKLMANDIAGI